LAALGGLVDANDWAKHPGKSVGTGLFSVVLVAASIFGGEAIAGAGVVRDVGDATDVASVASGAEDLQSSVPASTQGRITMGVGTGYDDSGALRTVVGTSEKAGYLRRGVTLIPGEELATGTGHAEASILEYMKANGIAPDLIGAGRPICAACADLLDGAGASPATPLKEILVH
jgi:filamentous hemagglutinin